MKFGRLVTVEQVQLCVNNKLVGVGYRNPLYHAPSVWPVPFKDPIIYLLGTPNCLERQIARYWNERAQMEQSGY